MASTVWKGQLTFGLVSVPVRLYTAARRERVRMHYAKTASPVAEEMEDSPIDAAPIEAEQHAEPVTRVRQEYTSTSDDRPVPREELSRIYEVEPQRYVTFQKEELRQLRLATSPEMQILRSVHLAEIDPVYFDTSYFMVPDRGGERPYALLFTALQQSEYVALAKVAMHGREHILVIRPGRKGLLAHTIFYNDEVRSANEVEADLAGVVAKELTLAKTFVEAIAGPFAPEEFTDAYREQVRALIAGKVEREEIAGAVGTPQASAAPVVNILDALKKSLEMAKKPVSTAEVSRRAPGKVTGLKKAERRKA